MPEITVTFTPPDLLQRMARYPERLDAELERTTKQALMHTLGRSVGLGGQADIFEVRSLFGGYDARLGTNVEYAPPVIGDGTQTAFFKGRGWWTMRTVLERAKPGIERLYEAMCKRMVEFLGG